MRALRNVYAHSEGDLMARELFRLLWLDLTDWLTGLHAADCEVTP